MHPEYNDIQPGISEEQTFVTGEEQSALMVGSGSLPVLATPVLITTLEKISHRMLEERLPQGTSSVGISVDVQHLAPTPMGMRVRVRSQIHKIDGRRVTFSVQAWDSQELIFSGQHTRAVIDTNRFLKHVEEKAQILDKK